VCRSTRAVARCASRVGFSPNLNGDRPARLRLRSMRRACRVPHDTGVGLRYVFVFRVTSHTNFATLRNSNDNNNDNNNQPT